MLKKTITYVDYNGTERTEDFYFNFTKSELAKMELSKVGGVSGMIDRIVAAKDQEAIVNTFEELILKSYGVKSEDGKRFIKSPEISEAFSQTEAYDQLFMELLTNTETMTNFFNGIVPKAE